MYVLANCADSSRPQLDHTTRGLKAEDSKFAQLELSQHRLSPAELPPYSMSPSQHLQRGPGWKREMSGNKSALWLPINTSRTLVIADTTGSHAHQLSSRLELLCAPPSNANSTSSRAFKRKQGSCSRYLLTQRRRTRRSVAKPKERRFTPTGENCRPRREPR